jgi:hypothetical protein
MRGRESVLVRLRQRLDGMRQRLDGRGGEFMRAPTILGVVAVSVAALTAARSQAQASNEPGTEGPGLHGMLVVGLDTIYVSHLPMFNLPHRYQGIWEVSFGTDADKQYRAERARPENADKIFTLNPKQAFRLPELANERKSFKADVFVGHFERPGHRLLLSDVTVALRTTTHFHPFKRSQRRPDSLTYVVFGKGKELFLAHWISLAPNYDQVLALSPAAGLGEPPAGAVFTLPGRADAERLRAGQSVSGVLVADQGPEQPPMVRAVDLKAASEFYFEEGELADNDLPPRP